MSQHAMRPLDPAKLAKIKKFADINVKQLPLVKIRTKNYVPTIDEFGVFLECFGDVVEGADERVVLLFDLREGTWGFKTVVAHFPMLLLKLKKLRPRFATHLCCSSVIASNKETRDLVNRVPKSRPCRVWEDDREAYPWMAEQLKRPQDEVAA